jgi:mRNA interferase MazF
MAIREHPHKGSILTCNFDEGFKVPEMVKNRPVVVISSKITSRKGLCTVVALSTTPPEQIMPYHCQIDISPPLPSTFKSNGIWVKGDMIYSVGFHRLDLILQGKYSSGKRNYYYNTLSDIQLKQVQACVLHGLSLSHLTKHL